MNKELTEKLLNTFPNLYVDKNESIQVSLIPFGFECDDGWFNIIWEISDKLEKIILKYKEENPEDEYFPRAIQVKEKFGSLRFYMRGYTDEISDIIDEAESRSDTICEVCGGEGKLMSRFGWYKTVCLEHAKKLGYLELKKDG